MSDSPESVVRRFLAALQDPSKPDEIASFFADDGVYVDSLRGANRGINAIRSEFHAQAAMGFGSVRLDTKLLVADGGTVMTERVDAWSIAGKPFSLEVLGVFEVDSDGRIKRWRDYYDSKSVTDQLEAAGFEVPA